MSDTLLVAWVGKESLSSRTLGYTNSGGWVSERSSWTLGDACVGVVLRKQTDWTSSNTKVCHGIGINVWLIGTVLSTCPSSVLTIVVLRTSLQAVIYMSVCLDRLIWAQLYTLFGYIACVVCCRASSLTDPCGRVSVGFKIFRACL